VSEFVAPSERSSDVGSSAPLSRASDVEREVALECVRTMYAQVPSSFAAGMGVTLYMTVTMWNHAPHRYIAYFVLAMLAAQIYRFAVFFSYRRSQVSVDDASRWANRYMIYMLMAGIVWGAAPLLFFRAESPLSQVFTMCGVYGVAAGSVPAHAYHPPTLRAFLLPIFGAVMVRMLMLGTPQHVALGVASLFYMGILLSFGHVQHRAARETIRMRFENVALVERLRVQKGQAEAAQRRAEQADFAKSQFLAAASHDLRQPLHALGLFSATLRELALDGKQRNVVEQIYHSIDSLEALFDELLDVSKLDAGYVRPSMSHFPIQRVLDELATRYRALADDKGLAFTLRPSPAVVRSDPALLERVLGNLVGNAIRYTNSGGVLLACRKRRDALQIDVWDTGIGIAENQQPKIFEEFFQIGNPERDRRKGLGLGLPIAQRIGALLGTPIELRSVPGRGSVFRIRVPFGDPAAVVQPPVSSRRSSDALSGRCVVVIDDEASIRDGMRDLLSKWGCTPIVASSPDEAVTSALRAEVVPALIVADYRLRGDATGADAVAMLRARFGASLPALLITGDTAPERLREAAESGLHVLHKPVRPAQLRALCNHLLTATAGDNSVS